MKDRMHGLLKNLLVVLAVALFAVCAAVSAVFVPTARAEGFSAEGRSAYLVDAATFTPLYAKNENERLPIASMVKIMTVLLTLEAVDRGELSLDEKVPVSENAASMGGSQVFLDAGTEHRAGDLLKSVIVASANDSCVALAERVSGSAEGFVSDMNARAAELGMKDTRFANCTGLPAAESFSTAHDVALMFREVIRHPVYFEDAGVWLEDYVHPDGRTTVMTNTNKLVKFYNGCDGGKTGFTSEAKFCLAATAERDGMRVIAVVAGADSSKSRFNAVSSMFNHAFGSFKAEKLLGAGELAAQRVKVAGGKERSVGVTVSEDIVRLAPRSDKAAAELRLELPDKVKAPVRKGDVVGKGYVVVDGTAVREFDLVAAEDVARASIWDLFRRIGQRFIQHFPRGGFVGQ